MLEQRSAEAEAEHTVRVMEPSLPVLQVRVDK